MKPNPIPVIAVLLLLSCSLAAQDDSRYSLLLKSGSFIPEKNITAEKLDQFSRTAARTTGINFAIIQFEQIPTAAERQQLQRAGIELLDYIPNYAYTATISATLDAGLLTQLKTRAVVELPAVLKMEPELAKANYPSWALKSAGTIDVWISFPKTFSFEMVSSELRSKNFEISASTYKQYRVIALRVATERLGELASLPIVEYVQAVPHADQPLNYNSMFASRANVIKASLANGGRNLAGQGVVVGIGDDGDPQTHLDFTGRLINRVGERPRAHASHVTGTIGGAGIIQELYAGYAPKSTLLNQVFSNIFTYAPAYVQDNEMVITNNSYGSVVDDCDYNGRYDLTARILDQQAFDLPELQHVFAAGNDGNKNCGPYPAGFRTVLGGFQAAKNVLTVGSTDYKSDWSTFSSKGPVRDGRLKPEVMSMGQFEASTWTNNLYSYNNGTSMAAPGVAGGLALLIQRYRQLHGGANPKNSLMKALLCNGANDRGNAGADFSYGFGQMNLLRSLVMLESSTYFSSSLTNGASNTHSVNIPPNTALLKVLLYWQDPPAAVMAARTLVNDIDLQVITPSATTVLPSLLDTIPANVNTTAGTGGDHINNIEQIVISNPAAGNYNLKAIGTAVTQGSPQEYQLVYDIIPQSLVLTNPVGGEALTPTGTYTFGVQVFDTMYVQWDDYNSANEMFTAEFSGDGGSNWSLLSNNIPSSSRLYKWPVPNMPTDKAKIRLSKNNTAFTQTSNALTITALPVISLSSAQCEGYINISWAAVPGATDYEVMKLQGDEMISVGTTTNLNYIFSGLSKDTVYWVTMRARINGKPGRRANALSRQPNNGTCAGTISDNDLKADAIVSPATSGRKFTSSELTNSVPITIRIKNLDDNISSGNISVSYSINGGAPVSETITTPLADIAAGATLDHTFGANADLSSVATYSIAVTATKASDPVTANNSLIKSFKQLSNTAITNVDLPWTDNFDAMPVQSSSVRQMGLAGNDRYDFMNSTVNGRIRSFINSGMSYSGTRALTLDADKYLSGGNIDSLTGTFNLNTFNTATDDIRLDFRYKNHGQLNNAANKVWIRGSENDNWIQVYDLFANQSDADGTYKLSASIELSDSLAAHGQSFSTSFQARWGQWGQYMAADNESAAGYSFDDIRIYKAANDIQMLSIDTPTVVSCGLNSTVPVKVTVHNTSGSVINNIPVVLKVDGSTIATENIASIAGNGTIQYTFAATANLTSAINHTIEVWTNLSSDSFHDNDTARITVNSLPVITSFPYLQDFEAGNGSWYSAGKFSTWEYGTPISAKINRAASGSKAWKTGIAGYYNDLELSFLYSPCFNLSGMTNPTLSFSMALDIEDCGNTLCDAAWVEYSTNGGVSWSKLGTMGQGTNWYNKNYSGNQLWSQQNYTRWHVATAALPASNNNSLRLRIVFSSDNGVTKDGIAIDDIHIYDNVYGIYDITGSSQVVNQTAVTGNGWTNFIDGTSNKIIASVNPGGQSLGSTDVQVFITAPPVRNFNGQYYLNRNITIKPALEKPADSVSVKLYFLDSETDSMVFATGCASCPKLATAYDLGVSQYSDSMNHFENGILTDDSLGVWHFIPRAKLTLVPFLNGYYSEFKVNGFSEFWLNSGGSGNVHPLRNEILQFSAQKVATNNVLLHWTMANENNITRYEMEVARGNDDLQNGRYAKIGQVSSNGNSNAAVQYIFTDTEAGKSGVRYYRIKIIYSDGGYTYSSIRSVLFPDGIIVRVYPNPTTGIFNIVYQMELGQQIHLSIMDAAGRLLKEVNTIADGFLQKQVFDFSSGIYPAGIYLFRITADNLNQSFKVVKQ